MTESIALQGGRLPAGHFATGRFARGGHLAAQSVERRSIFTRPLFWVAFIAVSAACTTFAWAFSDRAFPIVALDIEMDRDRALIAARELAEDVGWGPRDFRQAASFGVDEEVQTFVELGAGGTERFRRLIEEGPYVPYTWQVRHFREHDANETSITFTPEGKVYGFVEQVPESRPGPALPADEAREIAQRGAFTPAWRLYLSDYDIVESSQETRPNGRADHTFVYERRGEQLGGGRYRLRLTVIGDRFTELTHFVEIPESFERRHSELRSFNDVIAFGALFTTGLLYVLGGCVVGLFILLRGRWVIWRKPLGWGLFVGFLLALVQLNFLPLSWMEYDTAVSRRAFLLQQFAGAFAIFLGGAAVLSIVFMAAETLSRKAFPHHLQLWRLWSRDLAGSKPVFGRTAAGYLFAGIDVAFVVAFYIFVTKVLGWYVPSEPTVQPDILAAYFPWLTPIGISLYAGFFEESLFRAVPIAGAALVGERLGKRKLFIAGALVLQAVVFAAGHANYPAEPPYARLVELMIPSIVFGLFYIFLGLLPGIILHFTFDVVAIAIPIFTTSAPGVGIDRAVVVVLALVPFWVVLRGRLRLRERLRSRGWTEAGEDAYNRQWSPSPPRPRPVDVVPPVPPKRGVSPRRAFLFVALGVAGLGSWLVAGDIDPDVPAIDLGRTEAIEAAEATLGQRGVELDADWEPLTTVFAGPGEEDRFVWQTSGVTTYRGLVGTFIDPPGWQIRYARFRGDVVERAEEYAVYLSGEGKVFRFVHQLPEETPGANLSEAEARPIAERVLREEMGEDPARLRRVGASPSKRPSRTDWSFTYSDRRVRLQEGEARLTVEIAGDQVADYYRHVHIPEEWLRAERDRRGVAQVIEILAGVILAGVLLGGAVIAVIRWSRGRYLARAFMAVALLMLVLNAVAFANGWPSLKSSFSTSEPLPVQVAVAIGGATLGFLFVSAIFGLVAGLIHTARRDQEGSTSFPRLVAAGTSLGLFAFGIGGVLGSLESDLEPFWPDFSGADHYLPILSGAGISRDFLGAALLFGLVFLALDSLSGGWTKRRKTLAPLTIAFGFVIAGAGGVESVGSYVGSGIAVGGAMLVAYLLAFRFDIALVPLAVAGASVLQAVEQARLGSFEGASAAGLLGAVLVAAVAVFWARTLAGAEQHAAVGPMKREGGS